MGLRRRISGTVATLVATALLVVGTSAHASERDEAYADQQAAEAQIDDLRSELVGIEADLAELYIELEQVNLDLPVMEAELEQARIALEEAQAELAAATEQLEAAEATQERLAEEIELSQDEEEELSAAVGEMARELYRGNQTSPMQLVLTSEGTGDIAERATSANTMSRAQTRALDDVRDSLAVTRNQAERQEATTERVTELKAEAAEKEAAAEELEADVERQVEELTELRETLVERQKEWDARKGEAEAQLESWQASRASAATRIEEIDEANRQAQLSFEAKRAAESPEAASRGSSTGSGFFGYPLPAGSAYVSSNYGWRIHPIFGTSRLHDGVDFAAACGSPQYAISSGRVVSSYYDSGGGNIVTINHGLINGSSWVSEHLHLQGSNVYVGQSVDRGDMIGWTGTTGNSTGCHLHLSLYKDGSTVDPLGYM